MTPSIPLIRSKYFSHRSGLETDWGCGRAGYLSQFHLGTGIQAFPRAYWLDVGIAVHIGLQQLMLGQESGEAVKQAVHYWDNCGQEEILQNLNFVEQRVLIEALLWSFVYYTLADFMRTYEVLWVEQEILTTSTQNCNYGSQ